MKTQPWHKTTRELYVMLVSRSIGKDCPIAWTVVARLEKAINEGKV